MTRAKAPARRWSAFEIEQLRRLAAEGKFACDIARLLNRDTRNVRSKCDDLGIELARKFDRKVWTDEEKRILIQHYPHHATADLLSMLPRHTVATIIARASALKLRKSAEHMERVAAERDAALVQAGAKSRFGPEHKSYRWNAGTKGISGQHPNCRKTQFKKKQVPHNHMPVGSERIAVGYVQVKVTDDPTIPQYKRWDFKHHVIWEQANGPIPEGMMITFRDGNRFNITIENLELISLAENGSRSGERYHKKYPKEFRDLVQLRGQLTRQINKREKEMKSV